MQVQICSAQMELSRVFKHQALPVNFCKSSFLLYSIARSLGFLVYFYYHPSLGKAWSDRKIGSPCFSPSLYLLIHSFSFQAIYL